MENLIKVSESFSLEKKKQMIYVIMFTILNKR